MWSSKKEGLRRIAFETLGQHNQHHRGPFLRFGAVLECRKTISFAKVALSKPGLSSVVSCTFMAVSINKTTAIQTPRGYNIVCKWVCSNPNYIPIAAYIAAMSITFSISFCIRSSIIRVYTYLGLKRKAPHRWDIRIYTFLWLLQAPKPYTTVDRSPRQWGYGLWWHVSGCLELWVYQVDPQGPPDMTDLFEQLQNFPMIPF